VFDLLHQQLQRVVAPSEATGSWRNELQLVVKYSASGGLQHSTWVVTA